MFKLDTTFLQQHRSKIEQIVQEGRAAELREQDGFTNDNLINEAKKVLGISSDDFIVATFENILKQQNLELNSLLAIVNALNSGKTAFSEDTVKALENSRDELIEKVASNLKINKEDMIEEGE